MTARAEADASLPGITTPEVCVIIVNYNAGVLLSRTLEALRRQTWRSFRTVVVDNASSDGSVATLQADFPEVELIRAPANLGFAGGNNVAVRRAGAFSWIALLNPDAFPEPQWLDGLMRAARRHPEFSSFASRIVFDSDPETMDAAGDEYHLSGFAWRRMHGRRADGASNGTEVFAASATAALYRRDVLDEARGFDERYFCYYEDVDLGLRLRLLGHRAYYVPEAAVRHVGSAITGRRSSFVTFHTQRNRIWTYVKNMPSPWIWILLPLHLAYQVLALLLYAWQRQLVAAVRGLLAALRQLPGILASRREVQRSRRVRWSELSRTMQRGLFAPLRRR
jgi:GT2 family glycosyltransferase